MGSQELTCKAQYWCGGICELSALVSVLRDAPRPISRPNRERLEAAMAVGTVCLTSRRLARAGPTLSHFWMPLPCA